MTLDSFPSLTREKVSVFRWTSSEEVSFKCGIDDPTRFVDCGSGRTGTWPTPQLRDGQHTFYLVALDTVGNKASLQKTFTVGKRTLRHYKMCIILVTHSYFFFKHYYHFIYKYPACMIWYNIINFK